MLMSQYFRVQALSVLTIICLQIVRDCMDRDDLRLKLILLLTDEGPKSAQGLSQRLGENTTPTEIRGSLMNLQKEGLVEQSEQFGRTKWKAKTAKVEAMLERSLDDLSSINTDPE